MIKSIEEMYIWHMSRDLVNEIYKMMSVCSDYGFRDQIQRAAISIMNNIAEGFDSGSVGRFVFHLKVSRGSCAEVDSMLYLCEDFNLCDEYKRIELQNKIKHISSGCLKIINGYKRE